MKARQPRQVGLVVYLMQNLRLRGRPPRIIFARWLGQRMPYNFVHDSFHTGVTAEALRAKIDRKSAISLQRGQFDPKFQVLGVGPTNDFCMVS